jgi:ATP-dependent Lon protease
LKPSGGGDKNLPTGIFEAGNYAFIREKNRRNNTKWSELTINQRNGRIVYTTSLDENKNSLVCDQETNPPEKCYYKENSYIVVEVNKAKTSLQKDMSQMLYKDLVTDLSDAAPAILREDLPADALEQLSAGLSELRNSDQMIQDINILESDSISEVVNKSIGESFMELWFGTQKDTQNNDILKHKISATDKERMERRLSELVFHCQKAKDSVNYSASVMNIMKDIRERKISNSSDLEIYEAISCKFKQ